ncbi:MAG: tyrosine-type recombinase/integrase [Pseudomonadales bacterium]|jgi:integrase
MLLTRIDRWLATRRANGFALEGYERHLHQFAEFSAARGDDHIRAETAVAWASQMATPGQRNRHYQRIVQLARYLHAEDPRNEIPPNHHFPGKRQRPVPHIYTPDEACRLVEAAARLGPVGSSRPRTVSTMLSLLFATGLRISEALAVRMADVTPDGLIIRKAKFGKTRLVPLHPSAQNGLGQYLHYRRAMAGHDDHVFVSLKGTGLSYGAFRKAWNAVLDGAGLLTKSRRRRPRIHDTRHTFAVRALESAPDQRNRIDRHMLAVSTYLGHGCVSDTYWYFQATPALMAQVADTCQRHFEGEQS